MRHEEVWEDEAAKSYDTPGTGMFAPEVLGPAVDRLAELAGTGAALEFAIGTGRVAVPLRERGIPVIGIEIAAPMVAQLRTKADEATIPVVLGDMTTAVAPGRYTLVYLVFNGISNLLTQAEQVACFRNAARHLVPGGCFVIELWVPELRKMPPGQEAIVCRSDAGYILVDTYDVLAQHVVSHHFGFGEGRQAQLFRSPHRYVWPTELDLMAQLAGFELESRDADWARSEFTAESRSHVSVYRIPAQD
ncbi:MAG TPA: class I SAM-dependent methyltransferase [Arsenicitalea sp.]|jgi:SAM-dependent methyltransferase|nr:class I SAM-dependent methyltransferase [Arsenicitalea sp.]